MQTSGDAAGAVLASELADLDLMLDNDRSSGALKGLDERGGAQVLVSDQYSGRYPFELLQNANDAALETGRNGRAHFELTETALIVADNGTGFGEEQVDAICSLGRSSKGPATSVGHKGLGFKSVGEITDQPQIISDKTSFRFDSEQLHTLMLGRFGALEPSQRFPVYAFPFPVVSDDLGPDVEVVERLRAAGYTTVVRLPLRPQIDVETVAEHLKTHLVPRLLLFLRGIDYLALRGTNGDFSAEVVRDERDDVAHVYLVTDEVASEEWLLYRGSVATTEAMTGPLGDAWREVETAEFAVAVPLDEDGEPTAREVFPLHVYFPTEDMPGLHVAVHAQCVLTMDRRHLAVTPDAVTYNRVLLDAVGALTRDRVIPDILARTQASVRSVVALLPAAADPQSNGAIGLRRRWIEAAVASDLIPCVDGRLRNASQVVLLPAGIGPIPAVHSLADLDPTRTVRPDIEAAVPIRRFLGCLDDVRVMSDVEMLGALRHPTTESAADYYDLLLAWREARGSTLLSHLREVACVLTTVGPRAPGTNAIFFPRQRAEESIPDDIPVPIVSVPDVEVVTNLFKELGVNAFEWRELIRTYLIRILSRPKATDDERSKALSGLRAYGRASRGGEELAATLARVLLPARSADGAQRELQASGGLYFGADWTGSPELELIYGPFNAPDFLDIQVPVEPARRAADQAFYRMLGVVDHPRISEARPDNRAAHLVGSANHPHRGALFNEWMAQDSTRLAARCPDGHPQTQFHRVSFRLDRLEEVIASEDPT